ncbi:MAG: M42 family metallopeptidase [Anaerolineae bacterium]
MDIKSTLKRLSEAHGVSGYETEVREIVVEEFRAMADEVRVDKLGNVIALKRGDRPASGNHQTRVMLAGHMDEIGLMVTKLEKGFLHFTTVGSFDQRVLLGQEVTVHGRRPLPGVIGSRPPHVLPREERDKVIPIDKLFIDVGLAEGELAEAVQVGDLVTLRRDFVELKDGCVVGKALDDRTSLVVILNCFHLLTSRRHAWDVFGVATVQEEVNLAGAFTSTYGLSPDIGIAIDVTFGSMTGLSQAETFDLGKGPSIAYGPNIHPRLYQKLVEVAQEEEVRHQIEPVPGSSGTDAWAMQVVKEGIPTALVSVPLRNMHTSVELLSLKDVERASRLLASFIVRLDDQFLDSLKGK